LGDLPRSNYQPNQILILNPRLKKILQFCLFFGLGLGLIWWQFNSFNEDDRAKFFFALKTAHYGWFALAIFIGMLAHLSRAIRWKQLLTALGHKAGLGNRFYAVMMGYLANYGLPRSGEFIRCTMLKESDDIPFGEAFGTVIVERIVDSLCLLLVFIIVMLTQLSQLSTLWGEYISNPIYEKIETLSQNPTKLYLLIGIVVLIGIAFFIFRKKIKALLGTKLGGFVKGFKDGLLAVKRVPNPGWFIFHSLLIWSGYLGSLYVCFYCFDVTSVLTLNDALVILIFGTFGVVFTPGGIGLYQIVVTGVVAFLLHLDIQDPVGAPFAWLSWGSQVATVILFTGIGALMKPVLNRYKA
jgi:glycosyltransferase 2 family protein